MDQKYANDMFYQYKDFTFPTYKVNVIELSSNKRSGNTTISTLKPPFSGLSPLSSKKFRMPPSNSVFGRSYPSLVSGQGVDGSTMSSLSI